jgi:plastocyanin
MRSRLMVSAAGAALFISALSPDVSAAQSAATSGRVQVVVTTKARPRPPVRVTFDQQVCGAELPDGSVITDAAGHLANVVVSLVGVKARAPARQISVLNEKCAFVPRVQVVAGKATVRTSSRDPVLHTTVVQQGDGRQLFNVALPVPGLEIAKPLAGTGPFRVGCSTHQWMRGWIVVTDDVAAVTGRDGRVDLPDVPPGRYQLRVWHEALKAPDQTVTAVAGQPVVVTIEMR